MNSLVLIFALISAVSPAEIVQCDDSATVDMANLKVTGCKPGRRYCTFRKGQAAALSLPFTPVASAQNITAVVHGIIAGVPVPFPLPQPNACVNSGLSCPMQAGTEVTYSANLPVRKEYPRLRLIVKWELQDAASGHDIVCIKIPVQIR